MFKWLINLISDTDEKKLKKLLPIVEQINTLEESIKKLSEEELKGKTTEFRARIEKGATLDELLPEAFAVVREASVRTIGLRHFDVQLLGGIILHQGAISEMKTGEGKTLVATLPMYLNALTGKGVHLVTVNDYLARRDSEWMSPIFRLLGMTVGVIQHHHEYKDRQMAYACDITYGTNNEFGFDYLRDNMAFTIDQCCQRPLHFAIVDEVDSILIDEARTPLIISGVVEDTLEGFSKANQLARKLVKGTDFDADDKNKNATLTEAGVHKLEKLLNVEYLFDVQHMSIAHQILQSIKAWHLYKLDVDYVIKDGEVVIVDEFTGRLMVGRRYSDGLHQAIEAKEGVQVKEESQTLATITFQNYFRLYEKLAGMTGTAKTEEAEFWKIYKLAVFEMPPNKPMVRKDFADIVFKTKKGKYAAVVNEIIELQKKGQPVLVGTVSIENSEYLSSLLKRKGIKHEVLNAKQHEREAEIVSQAGQHSTVTISTNMAGRGTDIVLGAGVKEVGGLHILGTERHESRRIDNQLRGRAGRQGDPGSSRFYVSLEDELMRLFGSKRVQDLMDRWGITEEIPIENRIITGFIEKAQKKVEEYYFSIRKSVLEFDDVMNKQRDTIYRLRRRILERAELKEKVFEMLDAVVERQVTTFTPEKTDPSEWDWEGLQKSLKDINPLVAFTGLEQYKNREGLTEEISKHFKESYDQKEANISSEHMRNLERVVMLRVLDQKWIEQLDNMDNLRDGINLRAYGQRDPLIEYKIEGYGMFQEMMEAAQDEIIGMLYKVALVREGEEIAAPIARNITLGAPAEGSSRVTVRKTSEVGRNDPCPCGSGKKYKKCCLLKEGKA